MYVGFDSKGILLCISLCTYLVLVGLWGQLLVQRSHLSCQLLEVIPEFLLLTSKNMVHR